MAMPRKPLHLKLIDGSRQPDPVATGIQVPAVSQLPEPPKWLTHPESVKEWVRVTSILFTHGMLSEAGLTTVAHMCAMHGRIVQMYESGSMPSASMCKTFRVLQNDCGLPTIAQGKAGPSDDKPPPTNAFASLEKPTRKRK